ncbi:MAG: dephospho-CoA kinase [Ostreibacterium sp.]
MTLSKFPLIIGLTGGIASGKTTVADYLAEKGAYLIDTDIIARNVVIPSSPTTKKIRALLGDNYFLPDGNLDRGKIKQYIFNDDAIRAKYESIILPAIRHETLLAIDHRPDNVCYALLIVPLLFEKGLNKYTHYNISIDLPIELQVRRGVSRKLDDETIIRLIIDSQMPRETRNIRADFVVDNTVTLEKLQAELNILHSMLCALSPKEKD